jgi:KamA family protein
MEIAEALISTEFNHTGDPKETPLSELVDTGVFFLEFYGTAYLLGDTFGAILGHGSGRDKFRRLLEATGFPGDSEGFFRVVLDYLQSADSRDPQPLSLGGVAIPQLLLTALLEKMIPGHRFVTIRNVPQLEQLTHIRVPEEQREDLQEVIDTYPVRLSMHTVRQMRISKDVAYQYLPFVEELDKVGHTNTWIGQFHQGLLEQMYQNRVIFLLNMSCPVYCRFCFRKHKESRDQENPTPKDVAAAVEHVRDSPSVKEIVITGGDPFLNRKNLSAAMDGLQEIPHVQTLRLATRSVAYYPSLFLAHDEELLTFLKMKSLSLQLAGKRLELATHFIHPDEISTDALRIISELTANGIAVYVQTPFLKDCNDQGPELVRLFHLLRGAGAELHYIYIPCSPIHGNSIYWTPLSRGIEVAHHLRAHLSDRVMPRICTATPIGKMDWHSSGWAVRPDEKDGRFLWLRTPYTPDYFKSFAPLAAELDNIAVNEEGTIDARYMAEIGDPSLFLGSRQPAVRKPRQPAETDAVDALRRLAQSEPMHRYSVVESPANGLYRQHETRVEISVEAGKEVLDAIEGDARITDVIVAGKDQDVLLRLHETEAIVTCLYRNSHVNAVRLRSLMLAESPEACTPATLERLGRMTRLEVARPLRVEIETQFLQAEEITPAHWQLARSLSNQGVTLYANVPLLAGVNDSPEEMQQLAFALRQAGIEFHHLYLTGLPIQENWNGKFPVDVVDVIDIASRVRKVGSGREIPRYILRTPLGEVDFGLTSRLLKSEDGTLRVRLNPYNLDYYRGIDPEFQWPVGVEADPDGRPVVTVAGLKDSGGFLVFPKPGKP